MNIAVFASGRGSNLNAILAQQDLGRLGGGRVVLVISNNSTAGALRTAASRGIATSHLSSRTHHGSKALTRAMIAALEKHEVGLIVLAGYMKRLPEALVRTYRSRILNIHPALLPRHGGRGMYGIHVHRAVIEAGDTETGVTVHLVDEEYDHGEVLRQARVKVDPGDTAESLARRVLAVEHDLYWRVIAEVVTDLRGEEVVGISRAHHAGGVQSGRKARRLPISSRDRIRDPRWSC